LIIKYLRLSFRTR